MASRSAGLLCAGKEPELLRTRRAVLRYAGHDAQAATLPEAEVLLRAGQEFGLTIVSSSSSEWERGPHSLLRQRNAHPHIARADPRCGIAGSSVATVSACRVSGGG
jgi:hypothetical protein